MKYDKEEKSILDAYKKGKMKLSSPSKKEIDAIKATARNTLVKDKRITIRLYGHDYRGIQKHTRWHPSTRIPAMPAATPRITICGDSRFSGWTPRLCAMP